MKKLLIGLLTCAMLATGANAAFEKVNTYDNNFSDVKDTNWFSENVKSAYELGFMNGKSEGKFDPNGSVTVAEAITMASRLHSIYNGTEITKASDSDGEYRVDFDTMDGITPYHAYGEIQDGVLVLTADAPNKNGVYDPGVFIDNLDLKARNFDKAVIRMKRNILPNVDPNKSRNEKLQFYFQTSNDVNLDATRCQYFNLKTLGGEDVLTDWFEVEIPLSVNDLWRDDITRVRFDTTDNNGEYFIDYIVFKKDADNKNEKWYSMYVDYALDNKIIEKGMYEADDYARNASRAELCWLFAAALPEEYFTPVNNVTAIPDMDKNDYYSDIILMLYRAGVVLGDADGNFNAESDIKRSETAAIINRVALPENRVKGEITEDWSGMYYTHDLEFDNPDEINELFTGSSSIEIKDGHLVIIPEERPDNKPPKYDPKVGKLDTSIRADEFTTLKVRMKMELEGDVTSMKGEFYFTPDGVDSFNETNALKPNFDANYYVDAAGWRVYTIFLGENETWKGNITGFRFDPSNNNGVFTIDYIRFIRNESTMVLSDEELAKNYTARELLSDEGFEKGFAVYEPEGHRKFVENWLYSDTEAEPEWMLKPWWTKENFTVGTEDKYTVTDSIGSKIVTYNPEDGSLKMRLNADKIYNGKAHVRGEMWPHILIEQFKYPEENYAKITTADKELYDLGADKVYAEMEVKLNDFVDLDAENRQNGEQSFVQYNVYLYIAHKDVPDIHTYFGINPFDSRGLKKKYSFVQDSQSIQMIYGVPTAELYGGEENTLFVGEGSYVTGEWRKIRVDITSHLENLCSVLTRDDVLKREVKREDLWFTGANVGFEIWGNYQAEMEIRNFNVVCYDKK